MQEKKYKKKFKALAHKIAKMQKKGKRGPDKKKKNSPTTQDSTSQDLDSR